MFWTGGKRRAFRKWLPVCGLPTLPTDEPALLRQEQMQEHLDDHLSEKKVPEVPGFVPPTAPKNSACAHMFCAAPICGGELLQRFFQN